MIRRLSRWGILPRSAFTISLIAITAGLLSIGITLTVMSDRAGKIANQELGQIIDTVESTVQIACFVEDRALAAEVVRGLLKNTKISGVSIRAGLVDLASSYRKNAPDNTAVKKTRSDIVYQNAPLVRSVTSPFDPEQIVGEITLLPDHEAISHQVYNDLKFLGLILAVQWMITGVGMLVLILSTVIRPIKLISDQLHRMEIEVENGEYLTTPRGQENTEIGRLVDDINLLSSRLNVLIRHAKDQTDFLSEAKLKDDVLTRQLAEQNVALARAMQIQEEVERIARHDLKTPLNSIATVPALLRLCRVFTPEEDALLTIVENSAKRVLRMVSLSLDLFRMEEGLYVFNAQAVDLAALVINISKEFSEEARSRAVTFKFNGTERPVYVCGEEVLCYSILANVLKNAIEAVPVGGEIQIRIVAGKKVFLSINNSGVVPQDIRERFFEKYVSSGKIGGTGLGT
ncbi:MAG: HAMP domain-containing sensor histidine kinase [Betaproteobacteria bacterium]